MLVTQVEADAPESVHLTRWPAEDLAPLRDPALESPWPSCAARWKPGRTLRGRAGIRTRQPLARLWLALPAGGLSNLRQDGAAGELLALLSDELNVRAVELIGDDSELVARRVKPLLPVIGARYREVIVDDGRGARGRRALPPRRSGRAGRRRPRTRRGRDPRDAAPGTAVAHDEGVVVVIDTTLTPDAPRRGRRPRAHARRPGPAQAGRAPPRRRTSSWLDAPTDPLARLPCASVAADTLADEWSSVHPRPARRAASRGARWASPWSGRRPSDPMSSSRAGPAALERRRRRALFLGLAGGSSRRPATKTGRRVVPVASGVPPASPAAPTPVVGDLVRIAKTYNDGGIFGLFDAGRSAPGPHRRAVIAGHHLVRVARTGPPRAFGDGGPRAAARRRARQPHRPCPLRPRHRLRRGGPRHCALLRVQRRRRGDQRRHPAAPRRGARRRPAGPPAPSAGRST